LLDQAAIEKINFQRPKIYIYTDFGGGKNQGVLLADLQTSGEITSAAWKTTLQQELYINDSAEPLSPVQAAIRLAKTFPYEEKNRGHRVIKEIPIHAIVVHVVDPGVGNNTARDNPQPRSLVLRKDGVLFIGPDNNSLSFACPQGSISGIWEINAEALTSLSRINTSTGGTFRGRDIFCEAAFRLAAGSDSLIAIINHTNGNGFIGPNNGIGSSFFKHFPKEDIETFHLTKEAFESIKSENNNELAYLLIKQQPLFKEDLKEIDFLREEKDLIKDRQGRPKRLKAKIWVDLYGNIKTSAQSPLLNEVKRLKATVQVNLNGVQKTVAFAETFSQVSEEQLFIYNGSSGTLGPNPHRSKRYVELTANGIFGKFGVDRG
jgi:S-adenosylmethionine hydrolase